MPEHPEVETGDVIVARHPGGTCPRRGAKMRHGTVGGLHLVVLARAGGLEPAPFGM